MMTSKKDRRRSGSPVGGYSDVRELEAATFSLCDKEYSKRWGEHFLGGAGSTGGTLIRRVEGLHGKAATERSARACYDRLRKKGGLVRKDVAEWLSQNEYMAGHLAAYVLAGLAHPSNAGLRGTQLPPLSQHAQRFALILPPEPGDAFSDTVWLLFSELGRPPIEAKDVTNREVAVILILMKEAPAGWAAYDRRLKEGHAVTPAIVVHDTERRVREIAGSDERGAISPQ